MSGRTQKLPRLAAPLSVCPISLYLQPLPFDALHLLAVLLGPSVSIDLAPLLRAQALIALRAGRALALANGRDMLLKGCAANDQPACK